MGLRFSLSRTRRAVHCREEGHNLEHVHPESNDSGVKLRKNCMICKEKRDEDAWVCRVCDVMVCDHCTASRGGGKEEGTPGQSQRDLNDNANCALKHEQLQDDDADDDSEPSPRTTNLTPEGQGEKKKGWSIQLRSKNEGLASPSSPKKWGFPGFSKGEGNGGGGRAGLLVSTGDSHESLGAGGGAGLPEQPHPSPGR